MAPERGRCLRQTASDLLEKGVVIRGRERAVGPVAPIAGPPILDYVEAARFQVVVKQGPETGERQRGYVGSIVDDDIETVWGNTICDLVQKMRIALVPLECVDALPSYDV